MNFHSWVQDAQQGRRWKTSRIGNASRISLWVFWLGPDSSGIHPPLRRKCSPHDDALERTSPFLLIWGRSVFNRTHQRRFLQRIRVTESSKCFILKTVRHLPLRKRLELSEFVTTIFFASVRDVCDHNVHQDAHFLFSPAEFHIEK